MTEFTAHTAAPAPLPSPARFFDLNELKYHDIDEEIAKLRRRCDESRVAERPLNSEDLEQLDQLTQEAIELSRNQGLSWRSNDLLNTRLWYLLAAGKRQEASDLVLEAEKLGADHSVWSYFAYSYQEFKLEKEASECLERSIATERDLARTYELRLRLARSLVAQGSLARAEDLLEELQPELEKSTQKRAIVQLEADLWKYRADLAKARNDRSSYEAAFAKYRDYADAWPRLR